MQRRGGSRGAVALPLEQRFREEIPLLAELFSGTQVGENLPRLNGLHEHAEAKWREYVKHLPSSLARDGQSLVRRREDIPNNITSNCEYFGASLSEDVRLPWENV